MKWQQTPLEQFVLLFFQFHCFSKYCLVLQAIAYMGDDFMFQLFGKYRDMALAVKNPCHLNMAACLIKLKRYDEAIAHCGIVSTKFGFQLLLLNTIAPFVQASQDVCQHRSMLTQYTLFRLKTKNEEN